MERISNRRKLRNLIVNKKQLTVVIIGSIYLFLSIIIIFMISISPVYRDIFQSNDISDQRESAKVFIILSEKLVMALLATFILTFIPLMWVTHRVFGPLINFSNIFRKVSKGDLTVKICLRRGDLLKSEAGLANEMIQSLSDRINAIRKENDLVVAAFNQSAGGIGKFGSFNNRELARVHKQVMTCQKLLAHFNIVETSTPDDLSSSAEQENEAAPAAII